MSTSQAEPTTYYVSASGSDSAKGTSPSSSWKTIAKVTATSLVAGDTVLFNGGDTFSDAKLVLAAAGTASSPITVGSYGSGNATLSNGTDDAIYVTGGGYVIKNLNVTGRAGSTNYSGIQFYASGTRRLPAISVMNCVVTGWKFGINIGTNVATAGYNGITLNGNTTNGNANTGILIYGATFNPANPKYNHSNVKINNCISNNNAGISSLITAATGFGFVLGGVQSGTLSGCTASSNGAANGDSGNGPVGIMIYACDSVSIASCLACNNSNGGSGYADGDGIDIDIDCTNCVIEYCLSYGNAGAGILAYGGSDGYWGSEGANTIRYNICQGNGLNNSGTGDISILGSVRSLFVYGNTFISKDTGSIHTSPLNIGTPTLSDVYFFNNILYTAGTGAVVCSTAPLAISDIWFAGNCYWCAGGTWQIYWGSHTYTSVSTWRAVTNEETVNGVSTGLQADPSFASAGTAPGVTHASGIRRFTSYQLNSGSPLIGRGQDIQSVLSRSPGTQDYYGNILRLPLCIGAYQAP